MYEPKRMSEFKRAGTLPAKLEKAQKWVEVEERAGTAASLC